MNFGDFIRAEALVLLRYEEIRVLLWRLKHAAACLRRNLQRWTRPWSHHLLCEGQQNGAGRRDGRETEEETYSMPTQHLK
jgi:hypothetical protein